MKPNLLLYEQKWSKGIIINLLIILFLISNNLFCQNNNLPLKTNDTCVLESFVGKRVGQINYLNCTVRSKIGGYYLVLEKSVEGKTFLPFLMKKGQISPKNLVLQFSFIDSTSNSANAVYKICAYKFSISQNGENKYLWVSENLFDEFNNSIVNINSIEDRLTTTNCQFKVQ